MEPGHIHYMLSMVYLQVSNISVSGKLSDDEAALSPLLDLDRVSTLSQAARCSQLKTLICRLNNTSTTSPDGIFFQQILNNFLQASVHLVDVSIQIPHCGWSHWQHLSRCPQLRSLFISMDEMEGVEHQKPFPTESFGQLHDMRIIGDDQSAHVVLAILKTKPSRLVDLSVISYGKIELHTIRDSFSHIASSCKKIESIIIFTYEDDIPDNDRIQTPEASWTLFEPLRKLSSLTRLDVCTSTVFSLSNMRLVELLSSWPQFRFLEIVGHFPPGLHGSTISLAVLAHILELCPLLEKISVDVDLPLEMIEHADTFDTTFLPKHPNLTHLYLHEIPTDLNILFAVVNAAFPSLMTCQYITRAGRTEDEKDREMELRAMFRQMKAKIHKVT
jgi:hypothetical protein